MCVCGVCVYFNKKLKIKRKNRDHQQVEAAGSSTAKPRSSELLGEPPMPADLCGSTLSPASLRPLSTLRATETQQLGFDLGPESVPAPVLAEQGHVRPEVATDVPPSNQPAPTSLFQALLHPKFTVLYLSSVHGGHQNPDRIPSFLMTMANIY